MADSKSSADPREKLLLESHHKDPGDLYLINELSYFYSIVKADPKKAEHFERLFRTIVNSALSKETKDP